METENNEKGNLIAYNQDILNSLKHACEFERFLINYDLRENIQLYGETNYARPFYDNYYGYNMPDGWKHTMVDECINDMSIEDIKIFINDIGFIKCVELVNDCGFYEEEEGSLKALLTNDGLRRFFYCVMYEMIEIADGVKQNVEITEYQETFGDYWDPNHTNDRDDEEEEDDNDDDSDDDEEQIVPITDEALDRIGGVVAMCA